jgi:hypothetical protein
MGLGHHLCLVRSIGPLGVVMISLRVSGGILRQSAAIVKITVCRIVVPVILCLSTKIARALPCHVEKSFSSADGVNLVLPLPEQRHTLAATRFRLSK